ncbi:MAG: hypothetical protein LBL66_07305 [Clostridiales bacterium]|jgi:uncharacterized membrane protein|nr:hypothetical protein [Clostridiales bacterium]
MNKRKYVKKLSARLSRLSASERESAAQYYAEIIDDMLDDRRDWEEILSRIGSPADAARQVINGQSAAGKRRRKGGEADYIAPRQSEMPPPQAQYAPPQGFAVPPPNYGYPQYQTPPQVNINYNTAPPPQYVPQQPQYVPQQPPQEPQRQPLYAPPVQPEPRPQWGYVPPQPEPQPQRGYVPPQPEPQSYRRGKRKAFWKWYFIFGIVTIPLTIGLIAGLIGILTGLFGIIAAGFALTAAAPLIALVGIVQGIYAGSWLVFFSYLTAAFAVGGAGLLIVWLVKTLWSPVKALFRKSRKESKRDN